VGRVTTAIGEAGGAVAAMDFVETATDPITVAVTANAGGSEHADRIRAPTLGADTDAVPDALGIDPETRGELCRRHAN
jgi:hypothetical protein